MHYFCLPSPCTVLPTQNSDAKMVEHACVCFARLVDSFASDSQKLAVLSSAGLIPNTLTVLKST